METELAAQIREIKDRQDIYDCIMRYCRGLDRLDRAMLLSAYHPDALDDHGPYCGPIEGFVDYVFKLHFKAQHFTLHNITNHRFELEGRSRIPKAITCSAVSIARRRSTIQRADAILTDASDGAASGRLRHGYAWSECLTSGGGQMGLPATLAMSMPYAMKAIPPICGR
jgi:hypothetical protein